MAHRLVRRPPLAALVAILLAPALAAAEPGVWWEQTTEGTMGGMSMPPSTQRVCVPPSGFQEPPSTQKESCRNTEVKREGDRMTWKVECTGSPPMSGEGEVQGGKDAYQGKMAMRGGGMEMQAKFQGKRVGGDCDSGATRRQAAAIQQQAQEAQAQGEALQKQQAQAQDDMCAKAADEVQVRLYSPPMSYCKKPEQVARLCGRLGTWQGLAAYRKQQAGDKEASRMAKDLCKKDPEAARPAACAQAAAETKGIQASNELLEFVGDACPAEAQALAKEQCAGRKYTGLPPGYRTFCVKYAREQLAKDKPAPAAASNPVTDAAADVGKGVGKGMKDEVKSEAVGQGKKLIKGLFGK